MKEADTLTDEKETNTVQQSSVDISVVTMELVQQMVDWDKRKRILPDWKWKVMKDVVDGKKSLDDRMKYAFYFNLKTLVKKGFFYDTPK